METSVVDELYGDLDQGHRATTAISSDCVLNYDDDSVDIYSGLEDSPRKNKELGEKYSTFLSPNRVKESLDLYEELVTQEREEKDASYDELKSKFAAAQNQVQDLLAQLQQMQTKNSSLHNENTLLKKNICALIKTAKLEINRKDEEISKLYERSSRGNFHSSLKERQHDAYNRSSTSLNNLAGPVRDARDPRSDKVLAEVSQGKPLLNHPGDSFSGNSTPSPSVVLKSCTRTDIEDPLNRQNKNSHSLDLLPNSTTQDHSHTQGTRPSSSREKENGSAKSESSRKQNVCNETDRRKGKKSTSGPNDVSEKSPNKMDKNRPEREQRGSSKSSCGSSSSQWQQQDEAVTLRRSGHSRSPSENADTQSGKEESRHKQRQDRQIRHAEVSGSRSERSSFDKSHRSTEKRRTRDHHRKEERRQDSPRRSTRSEGIKEYQHKKTQSGERNRLDEKTSSRGDRQSTRSETSKEHERQDTKDLGTARRNNTYKTHVNDGKDRHRNDERENKRQASPSPSSQSRKKDQDDRRRTSGRTVESSRSKASSSRDDSRGYTYASSDRHGVSKQRRDQVKPSGTPDQRSRNTPEEAHTSILKTSEGGIVQETSLTSAKRKSPTGLTTSCESSGTQEESSPKRKLSFMETLNLTVSPIKKQNSSQPHPQEQTHPQEPAQPPPEDNLTNNSTKSLFEVDEEKGDTQDSLTLPTNLSTHPHEANLLTSLEFKEKELEMPKQFDGNLDETQSGKVDGKIFEVQKEKSIDRPSVLLTDQNSQASLGKDEERKITDAKNSGEDEPIDDAPDESIAQNDASQQEVATAIMPLSSPTTKTCSKLDNCVPLEIVSSTIGIKNTNGRKETTDSDVITPSIEHSDPCPAPLIGPSNETVNINTAAQEKRIPEQASSFNSDSTVNEMESSRHSQPVMVPHDEDSMMLTLRNIKVIPEAISPLTSPVRQIKRSQQQQQQRLGKETHIKSLDKDFSTSAAVADKDAVKMDMNKENKRPDSLPTPSVQKDQPEALSSTATEEDLEEGELISESDGESALVIQSPPVEKRSGLRNQSSSRSPRLQNNSQTQPVTPSRKEQEKKTTSKDSPKRRFKTVTVPPKVKISTCAEFMNMLLFIRSELRRKYMKLHKNVTKSSFLCIIEMSQASLAEYVNSVNFDKFCSQGNNIKPQLNKIILSVMDKVSNNGIVNRIFEQRAEDLKQKLWNFVDGQFDFLFKELKAALKSAPNPSVYKSCSESKQPNPEAKQDVDVDVDVCKIQTKEPLSTTENRPHKITKSERESRGQKVQEKIIPFHSMQCRGLGSSGKNIKATMEEGVKVPTPNPSSEKTLQEIVPAHENKTPNYTRHLSHSGSIQDRADFEILTEQQTSSLTFNLVTDSQMGDIFRCLLQGSDLLETGDNPNWPLNTPRKEGQAGESLLGLMTPSKTMTPSKLITTWTPISPYKFQMPLNPAVLDENCMLEVPSNAVPNPAVVTARSQQSYSILAEDLAVSLTIPSPLKSDGHLSFLQPASRQSLTTPSNIITAHYSEDALLDGEDATEQDIHLSLETDNSSSPSSTSGNWDTFQFKPNLSMQAEVMERSNDHFIVRIRQMCPGPQVEPMKEPKETLPNAEVLSSPTLDLSPPSAGVPQVTVKEVEEISTKNTSDRVLAEGSAIKSPKITNDQIEEAAASTEATESEHVEKVCQSVSRKRKLHHSGPKPKRSRREKSHAKHEKQRHKKRAKSSKDKNNKTPSKKIKTPSPQLSPNSLSAKNVIRKKGEVVVTWTREEDRDILVTLKTKGASSKTFAALATKLSKSQAQIEERFSQLMKLFKKKEKMDS
ncbi:CASP8-associated protein 2 [Bagarius yarrelli]|uniref:CASP8-associated protein 2 n=1 Tax=Bagarius yarrelli TaxID=175774 RepID=A0A556TZE9_BAGYA|nr:CASP8-associated protein 2 [Bagarius yarrelli]